MVKFNKNNITKILAVCVTLTVLFMRIFTPLGVLANKLIFLGVTVLFLHYKRRVFISKEIMEYIKAYGIFVLLTIPSIFFSDDWRLGIETFLNTWVWQFAAFIAIVVFIKRRDYLVDMLTTLLLFCSIDSLISIIQIITYPVSRGWGIGGWVSDLANMLIIILPMALVISMDSRFEEKLRNAANVAIACVHTGIVCNKGRGSWLTEIIVAPMVSFKYLKQSRKYLLIFIIVTLGTIAYMANNTEYVNRTNSITNMTTDNSNVLRIVCWKACVQMIKDYPLTGVGPGQFRKKYDTKYKYRQDKIGLLHAHNNFIHVTVESGILGAVGFLYFVLKFVFISLKNYRTENNPYDLLIFAVFFGHICLLGQTDYTMWYAAGIQPIMWFSLAVLLCLKESEYRK